MLGLSQYSTLGLEVGPLLGGLSLLVLELPWLTLTSQLSFCLQIQMGIHKMNQKIEREREIERERDTLSLRVLLNESM